MAGLSAIILNESERVIFMNSGDMEANPARIMIVDDTPANLRLLNDLLSIQGYKVFAFPSGEKALNAARQHPPDLILLDINMPQMNGYEVCTALKADRRLMQIPVIFISALDETLDKVHAFKLGGVDYVNKPFQIDELLARVETHLKVHSLQAELASININLEERVRTQVKEIAESQMATIIALANLAESRDGNTGLHLHRVQTLTRMLAGHLGRKEEYASAISPDFVNNIYFASVMHDIGKVGIPDQILFKPGPLTADEFEVMKTHSTIGSDTLQSVYEQYSKNDFIKMGIAVARHHHERWDGDGYPDHLSGDAIPLSARIMSLVDVYDALRSQRCYKKAVTAAEAREIIIGGRGSQFEPGIVDAFLEIESDFIAISEEYS